MSKKCVEEGPTQAGQGRALWHRADQVLIQLLVQNMPHAPFVKIHGDKSRIVSCGVLARLIFQTPAVTGVMDKSGIPRSALRQEQNASDNMR